MCVIMPLESLDYKKWVIRAVKNRKIESLWNVILSLNVKDLIDKLLLNKE